MKTRFFSVLTVICSTTLFFVSNTFAQNSSQWALPDGAIARFGKGTIGDIAYSPDGSRLAVGGSIGIWLYDTVTLQEVALLTGNTREVASVAYSPDGTTLAAGSYQEVLLWNAETGSLINTLGGHTGWVNSIAFSPDGTTLAAGEETGGDSKWVRLWDVSTGNLINTLEHTDSVSSVAFSPDGMTLASASYRGVFLWDVATGSLINTIGDRSGNVSVAFSPDGTTLALGGWQSVRLYDVATGDLRNTLDGHTNAVNSVAFSPDGTTLASGSYDNTARLWDVSTGKRLNTLEGHAGWVKSVAFSPDGRTLASGSGGYSDIYSDDREESVDDTVRLWDVSTGSLRNTLQHIGEVKSVAFSPDGTTVASAGGGSTVRLWDAATGNVIKTLEHTGSVRSVAFSPDGRTLAAGSRDNTVRLWDVASGSLIHTLQGGGNSVAFSPDGRTLAAGSEDNTVRLWDAATGSLINTLVGHTNSVENVAFSPDGRTLASGSADRTVHLWDAATGSLINTLENGTYVAFSPDGTTLASAVWSGVRLWNVATGDLIKTLRNSSGSVYSVVFSPDSRTLAAGSYQEVHLWDIATEEIINTLAGHTATVRSVAFSPDGRTLASGSADGTVLLWRYTPLPPFTHITGPYLWMIAPTEPGKGGRDSTNVDSLAMASGGAVTEADTAINGSIIGANVGNYAWTLGELTDHDYNINAVLVEIGMTENTNLDDVTSYALITLESATDQSDVTMGVNSDDSIKVWLNGEVVHTNAINRGAGSRPTHIRGYQDRFPVNLNAGDNLLLVKVSERNFGWGMHVGIQADVNTVYKPGTPPVSGELRFNPNTIADQTFTVGTPANLTLPIATGGTPPYTYTASALPVGLQFDAGTRHLNGTPTTVGITNVIYTVTDAIDGSTALNFSIEVIEEPPVPGPDPLDVNGDGVVTAFDLVWVALYYGKRGNGLSADVNADGIVNVQDLIAVAAAVDAANLLSQQAIEEVLLAAERAAELEVIAGAPMSFSTHALSSRIAYRNVTTALADAKHLTISDMRLVEKLMVLLEFLQLLTERHAIPETTTLLPNYPNPFNYLSNSRLYTNINTCEKYYTKNLQLNDPALLGRVCKVFDTK